MHLLATAQDVFAPFPSEVRALATTLRALVRSTIPMVIERAYPGWKGVGYRDPQAGYFCGIYPHDDHVRLLFDHGVVLPDPNGLLEGDGDDRRWVTLVPDRPFPQREIARLLREAVLHGCIKGR